MIFSAQLAGFLLGAKARQREQTEHHSFIFGLDTGCTQRSFQELVVDIDVWSQGVYRLIFSTHDTDVINKHRHISVHHFRQAVAEQTQTLRDRSQTIHRREQSED